MIKSAPDLNATRRLAILDAAFRCFATYGFKRVSMDDIAVAAGLSRPALYNHFSNKTEIFRACFTLLADQVADKAEEAAKAADTLEDGMNRLVDIAFIAPHREIGQMPHGSELLGMKTDFAADLLADWYRRIERLAADLIDRSGHRDTATPAPAMAARLFVHAIEGIKARAGTIEEAEEDMKAMVRLFVAALQPQKPASKT